MFEKPHKPLMKLNQFIPNSPKIQSPRKPVLIAKGCAAQT